MAETKEDQEKIRAAVRAELISAHMHFSNALAYPLIAENELDAIIKHILAAKHILSK